MYAVGIFLDIEGAFDNTPFDAMCESAQQHGIEPLITKWIESMLKNCSILGQLNDTKIWCSKYGLSVNPNKAKVVMFTRRRIGLDSLDTLTLNGQEFSLKSEVKYLGIILDSKLKWKSHVESRIKNVMTTLWTCSRALGKTWGLKPRVMYWLYTSVIKPMILHGALVWWTRTALITARKEFSRIQRMAAMAITGALRTTPTVALETLIGLPSLHLEVKAHAKATALRFHDLGICTLESNTTEHGKILKEIDQGFLKYPLDYIKPVLKYNIPYKVEITTRNEWNINHLTEKGGFVLYTVRYKKSGKVGVGIWGLKPRINISMPLGTIPTIFQAEEDIGPEPVVGLTEQSLKALPKNWYKEQHRKIWKYLVVPRQSKLFIKTPGLLLGDLSSMSNTN
ncbi:uncharacterized protein LOC126902096 [Daktulosphaira vitifoliae]|uniref:uncharacterized protein LOC126902096 n=1 Tax=Daktulosphaira vitifoliae TaxID=58002 RepID=UPI0021A9E255|nr:uncharacterized protein LOC126902096 [Daktulosphaira vitifoliae]